MALTPFRQQQACPCHSFPIHPFPSPTTQLHTQGQYRDMTQQLVDTNPEPPQGPGPGAESRFGWAAASAPLMSPSWTRWRRGDHLHIEVISICAEFGVVSVKVPSHSFCSLRLIRAGGFFYQLCHWLIVWLWEINLVLPVLQFSPLQKSNKLFYIHVYTKHCTHSYHSKKAF